MWLLYQNLQLCKDGYNYTLNQMYKRLVWSFKALYNGEEPTEDWDGNSIPGAVPGVKLMNGLWMAVWAIICDLDHVFKCYGMPNSNSNKPCGICPVDSCHLPWWDFRPNAKWIPRIYTKQVWLDAGLQVSCIWDIFGVSCLSFYPDWMHCKPLGIDKILLGSREIQKSLGCLLKCIRMV